MIEKLKSCRNLLEVGIPDRNIRKLKQVDNYLLSGFLQDWLIMMGKGASCVVISSLVHSHSLGLVVRNPTVESESMYAQSLLNANFSTMTVQIHRYAGRIKSWTSIAASLISYASAGRYQIEETQLLPS